MKCSNEINNIGNFECCNEIINPFGDDPLNGFLTSTKVDCDGNATLEYEVPNYLKIQSINPNVVIDYGGYLLEKPGYRKMTAYIKTKKVNFTV